MEVDVKIKRYSAVSMRAALALVRAEQGPDAVILSSRRGEDGIEVIAAVDYDEALFVDATRPRAPAPAATPPEDAPAAPGPAVAAAARPAARAAEPVPAQPRASAPTAAPSPALPQGTSVLQRASMPSRAATPGRPSPRSASASVSAPRAPVAPAAQMAAPRAAPASALTPAAARPELGYGAMQRELRDMRQMLETGLAGMTWNDKRMREPLQAQILEDLSAMGIAPDVAMTLAALAPRRTNLENPSHIPLALLVKHLPVVDDLSSVSGGIMAVVGPTGAGKTTTIAKLAARWCMRHGSESLALVSTDGYRIGARDQLMTYARILGAPMHAANNRKELASVLERLHAKKLVLIDTAGMGPRDVRLTEHLAMLKYGAARARVLLVLPAPADAQALDEIVCAYVRVKPAACVLTKLDEAASTGAVISTTLRHKLKIAYVSDGQRVPEDLHAAQQKRVALVRAALRPTDLEAAVPDEAYLARNFGRASAHA
jgi:flagellar biosynthesis protein FlhF